MNDAYAERGRQKKMTGRWEGVGGWRSCEKVGHRNRRENDRFLFGWKISVSATKGERKAKEVKRQYVGMNGEKWAYYIIWYYTAVFKVPLVISAEIENVV